MQSHIRLKGTVIVLRRWFNWIVAVVAIGAGVYFVVPALVPDRLVQAQVNEQIGRWTGGAFRLRADAEISVEPGFRVVVTGPAFVSANGVDTGPIVTADSLVAPLRMWPLLFGRVEVAELVLLRPDIDLRMPAAHFVTSAATMFHRAPPHGQMPRLGDVVLVDGTVRLAGATGRSGVSGLNMRFGTDDVTNAVAVHGGVFLGARHLRVDLQLDDVRAFVSDVGTHAKLNVRVGARHDRDQGDDAPSAQGIPYGISETLRQIADTFGLPSAGFGAMTAEGVFSVTPHVVTISDATFSLGGVEMEGHMRAQTAGRPVIAQLLDLPGAVGALVADAKDMDAGRWVDVPVTMNWLDGLDLDIALAKGAAPQGATIQDTAAVSLVVGDGTTSFNLAGDIEGLGQMQAALALGHRIGEPLSVIASGRVDTVSIGQITQLLATLGPPPLIGTAQLPDGTMNGAFDVTANGRTVGQILDSLNGSVTAQLTGGSLVGADLVATLESLARGREFMTEEKGPLIPAAGRTQFDQLDARVDLASGTASVSQVEIVGEQFGIDMLGEVQLAEGTMNVGGNVVLLSSPETGSRPGETLVDLPFGVGGTVFAPVVAAGVPTVPTAWADIDADADDQ